MGLEQYLDESEKRSIKSISKAQELIISRREALKRIVDGKNIIVRGKVDGSRGLDEIKSNSDAYTSFLKKEGFFKKESENIFKEKKEEVNVGSYDSAYKAMISDINSGINDVFSELSGGISNVDIIEKVAKSVSLLNSKLVNFEYVEFLSYSLKERNKNLVTNLSKLLHLLNSSRGDVIDYYTNKADIFNLIRTITNSINNLNK